MHKEFQIKIHKNQPSFSTSGLRLESCGLYGLPKNIAQDLFPALVGSDETRSDLFYLYNVIGFDEIQVFDLGIVGQFCVLIDIDHQRTCNTFFTKFMFILNDRFNDGLWSARQSTHRLFW